MTATPATARALDRLATRRAGDLLPLTDAALLTAAAGLAAPGLAQLPWITAGLAPFFLYDSGFARHAMATRVAALVLGFTGRVALLGICLSAIAFAARAFESAPGAVPGWIASVLLLTAGSRLWLAAALSLPAPPRTTAAGLAAVRIADRVPVTILADRPMGRWSAVFKAAFDRLLAALLVLALLPVLALIALLVRLDSPGPILFRQRRHGLNNAEFEIYKFRTMRNDPAPGALQQTLRGDPRVTRVGRFLRKWSLDELPQVFNVLGGSMALVGPRPHAVDMRTEQQLGSEIIETYPHRHRVRPGITGWSQVNGARGATDTVAQLRRRIHLDLYYIDHWSPLLDLRILSRTVRVVLRATNAF